MAEVQMANLPSGGVGLTAQGTPAVGTQPSLPVARDRALPAAAGRATPPQLPDGQGLHQASSSSAACAHRRRARLWGLASLTSAACPSSASARLPPPPPPAPRLGGGGPPPPPPPPPPPRPAPCRRPTPGPAMRPRRSRCRPCVLPCRNYPRQEELRHRVDEPLPACGRSSSGRSCRVCTAYSLRSQKMQL
jgi:hypothetical protein